LSGKVIVITSGKGGVGKTTATANLGVGLAMLGKSVVVVDADIGLRNLDLLMGLENRIVYDIVDVVENTCRLRQALIKDKKLQGLHLLPAAQTKDKTAVSPEQMKALCDELREQFDYIIVDSPAGIEQGFKNAATGADSAIIVTTPELSSVRDADRIIGILDSMEIRDHKLLVNRIRMDMVSRGEMMSVEDVLDVLAIDLIGVVPYDETIIISTNKGEPAVYDTSSLAGRAFKNIVARLDGEEVEFLNLETNNGFFGRIKNFFKRVSK
jgi:septum site-determining protein MinD